MDKFDISDAEILSHGFSEYASQNLSPGTYMRYKVVIDEFLENAVALKVIKGEYQSLFTEAVFTRIKRKSNVRPALLKFLEFLNEYSFVKEYITYLQLQNNIRSSFPQSQIDEDKEIVFLNPIEIKVIFSDRITYKTDEEANLLPLLCALSFFCLFKQRDVMSLKLSDVDLTQKKIKNPRYSDNPDLVEWISLDQLVFDYLIKYLEYRELQKTDSDKLIVGKGGSEADNSKINNLFNCFKRNVNKRYFGEKSISQELLVKSSMLYILTSNNENGIYSILLQQDASETFDQAFNEFLSIKREEFRHETLKLFNLDELLPKVKKEKQHEVTVPGAYSEENDINEEDLKMYNSENNDRNLELGKIIIQRMVRDSSIARKLKGKYDNTCQVCDIRIRKANGEYTSEAHHIKPYNKIHRGDDNSRNLIILCPNCHTQFDDSYYAIHPETLEIHCVFEDDKYHLSKLMLVENHSLGIEYLEYAWELFINKKASIIS